MGQYTRVWLNDQEENSKYFCCEIDMGNGELRTIVSGVADKMSHDDIFPGQCVVFYNLKARTMGKKQHFSDEKPFISNGMVLFCQNEAHTKWTVLRPPKGSKPGDRLFCQGEGETEVHPPLSNGQYKKIKEKAMPTFKTSGDGTATFLGKVLCTQAGPVKVAGKEFFNCGIS